LEEEGKSAEISPWIAENSNGSMFQPSEKFLKATRAAEEVFLEVHGLQGFCKAEKIFSTTVDRILKTRPESSEIPKEAITLFVRSRTYFRIRNFNRKQASDISVFGQLNKIVYTGWGKFY